MKEAKLKSETKTDKGCIWDLFRDENRLWDIEAELQQELRYYQNRLRALGQASAGAENALAHIYQGHMRRISNQLARMPHTQEHAA